uniref:Uncharacterized protein n=1 Tax=Triticum urartu TaxID=4572 RepID=A0A8R7QKR2_TRIUA
RAAANKQADKRPRPRPPSRSCRRPHHRDPIIHALPFPSREQAEVRGENRRREARAGGGMSGGEEGERRKVSREDIQLVQNLIERCLQLYMNQKEVVETLSFQAKIEPSFTELGNTRELRSSLTSYVALLLDFVE